jgi:hypothetical protein
MRKTENSPTKADWLTTSRAVAVLTIAAVAAFGPVAWNGFVNYDDPKNVLDNVWFRGVGWPQTAWAWTTKHLGVYQPLGWMLLGAEWSLWGLDPRGYHLTSLALHLATVLALYGLTVALLTIGRPRLMAEDPGAIHAAACLGVALYAVHSLRVEAVAWVSCQSYLPCALFAVLTTWAYVRAHPRPGRARPAWLATSLGLFAVALLCKAPALGLPAVLLVLDVHPLRRLPGGDGWFGPSARRVYLEKLPFVAASVLFGVLAIWARAASMGPVAGHTTETRVARAFWNTCFYLAQTVAPLRVSACYPIPLRLSLAEPRFFSSALVVLAMTAALVVLRQRWPAALAAWVVYLAMLVPSSGLVPTGGQYIAADRYCFLPTMGLAVLAAAALCPLLPGPRWRSWAVTTVGCAIVLVMIVQTREQCRTWRDSLSLWSHAAAVSTEPNPFAWERLASSLAASDPSRLDEAEAWARRAVEVVPEDPAARNSLTILLARRGKVDEALVHTREALRARPDNVNALVNLGNLLAMKDDPAGAEAAYVRALRVDPKSTDAHGDLGLLLLNQRRPAEAEPHLAEALRLNPGMAQVRQALERVRSGQNH